MALAPRCGEDSAKDWTLERVDSCTKTGSSKALRQGKGGWQTNTLEKHIWKPESEESSHGHVYSHNLRGYKNGDYEYYVYKL